VLVHEAEYGLSAVAVRFRQGAPWLLRPGVIMLLLADLGLLAAACVALYPTRQLLVVPVVTAAVGVSVALMVFTDLGGYLFPRPTIYVGGPDARLDAGKAAFDMPITIANAGGRSLLLAPQSTARNAFTFALERQTGQDAWTAVGSPSSVERGGLALLRRDVRNVRVGRGEEVTLRYPLQPGRHRARLVNATGAADAVTALFLIEEPRPAGLDVSAPNVVRGPEWVSSVADPVEEPAPAENATASEPEPAPRPEPTGIDAELRGVVLAGGDRGPRFLIVLHKPDGTEENRDFQLGDALYDPWVVSEFDPSRQAVTIARDDQAIRILNRGKRISLD